MNTKGLLIFFGIPVFIVVFLLFMNNLAFLGADALPKGTSPLQSSQSQGTSVADLDDKSFINLFFQTLNEKNANVAVAMLDPSLYKTQSDVDEWAKQFSAFEKVEMQNMIPSNESEWTDKEHIYKVSINATMTPDSEKATIPYYGWQNGSNTKWITVVRGEDGLWRVLKIASGM